IFFFQAEDGIRDKLVTGVQTCALPILWYQFFLCLHKKCFYQNYKNRSIYNYMFISIMSLTSTEPPIVSMGQPFAISAASFIESRSEERRVGKECRFRWSSSS